MSDKQNKKQNENTQPKRKVKPKRLGKAFGWPTNKETSKKTPSNEGVKASDTLAKRFPFGFLWKFIVFSIAILILIIATTLVLISTDSGTQYLLGLVQKIGKAQITYTGGNLVEGLQAKDIKINTGKTSHIEIDDADLKLGWRMIFDQEAIHFRNLEAKEVRYVDTKPPSGKPFDYKPIRLPVKLYASKLQVADFFYQKATRSDVHLSNLSAEDVSFVGTKLNLKSGSLSMGSALSVDSLVGGIDFSGDFAIDAKAKAKVGLLSRHHFSGFNLIASGSLKQLKAEASGRLGEGDLAATAILEPVVKDMPISGSLVLADTTLPFAASQKISTSGFSANFSGDIHNLLVDAKSHLSGKDIPEGDYKLIGETDFKSMQINKLTANTRRGVVNAQGDMRFSAPFQLNFKGIGRGLKAQQYIPAQARQIVPEYFDAGFNLQLLSDKKALQLSGDVTTQDDGSKIEFNLAQNAANHLTVKADVSNQGLFILPLGQYNLNLNKKANKLDFEKVYYTGEAGQLIAKGGATLPSNDSNPVKWQLGFNTKGINPKAFVANAPITKLVGLGQLNGESAAKNQYINASMLDITAELQQADTSSKPIRTVSVVGEAQAKLSLQNSQLQHIEASYVGRLKTQDLPKGYLDVAISGHPKKKLNIARFIHKSDAGFLQVSGVVGQTDGLTWRLQGQMQQFNPAIVLPEYAGNISGKFNTQGVWKKQLQVVRLDGLRLSGMLKGNPLQAAGSLNLNLNMAQKANLSTQKNALKGFKADNFKLIWGDNKILANGNDKVLAIAVDVSSLNQLTNSISGKLKGAIKITDANKTNQADMVIGFKANNLKLAGLDVKQGFLSGQIINLGNSPSQLSAKFNDLRIGERYFNTLNIATNGVQSEHKAAIKLSSKDTTLTLGASGGFIASQSGRFKHWRGLVNGGRVQTKVMDLLQKQPAQVNINTQDKVFSVSAHCWVGSGSKGKLCFTQDAQLTKTKGDVQLLMKDFSAEALNPFLPSGTVWQGGLHGNANLNWQKGAKPQIRAIFYSDDGKLGIQAEDPQDEAVTISYKRLSLIAITQEKGLKLRFDTKTYDAGSGYVDVVVDPASSDKTINGALVLDDIRLGIFKPFFPGIRNLSGIASLQGGMSGPLKGPQFIGNFNLKDGRVDMLGLPVNLQNIQLKSQIRGTSATLEGTFSSGLGTGKLTGDANWQQAMLAKLKLTGNNLALRQPPIFYAEVNPNLDFRIEPFAKKIAVDGLVDVVKATFRPGESDPNIIKQSSDVTLIMPTEEETQKILKAAKPWRINTDVALNLKQDVYFRGFGAAIPLQGGLRVKQSELGDTQGFGTIEVAKRVNVEAFGQSMDLTRGKVRFNGEINKPSLDIEAVKRISGSQVGLRIEGSGTNPEIVVFNDAGLSEQQAMNALVTGRINNVGSTTSETGFQNDVNNALAAAGISAGLQGTRSFTNKIGRGFGLSSLTVGATGSDDDANVNITGYLTPDLYLRYGVGVFTPINKLTLRYQMTNRVYLEATSAIEKAIDIFYNWRF